MKSVLQVTVTKVKMFFLVRTSAILFDCHAWKMAGASKRKQMHNCLRNDESILIKIHMNQKIFSTSFRQQKTFKNTIHRYSMTANLKTCTDNLLACQCLEFLNGLSVHAITLVYLFLLTNHERIMGLEKQRLHRSINVSMHDCQMLGLCVIASQLVFFQ